MDYQKAYAYLVGCISEAMDEMNHSHLIQPEMENALQILRKGLCTTEEMYLNADE